MAVMVGIVGALSSYSEKIYDFSTTEESGLPLVDCLQNFQQWQWLINIFSQPFIYPKNNLSYAENFLHMMFSTPCGE